MNLRKELTESLYIENWAGGVELGYPRLIPDKQLRLAPPSKSQTCWEYIVNYSISLLQFLATHILAIDSTSFTFPYNIVNNSRASTAFPC